MIPVIRRLIIISLLFGIFLFIQFVQVEAISGINPKTLIALGFAILASFTFGEILSIIKLPRVIGYLFIGMIFGPYSDVFFHTDLLRVFNLTTLNNLSLVNGVTLSVIAITAGMELRISEIKKSAKSISLIILLKVIVMFILITGIVFFVSSYIPFLSGASWQVILAVSLIMSVVSMGTSIELTLVVADEAKAKGKFIDLILSTAIVKDVVVIILLAVALTISTSLTTPSAGFDFYLMLDLGKELIFSVIFGAAWGGLIILYLKYVNRELLIFIIAIVVFGTEITTQLHLETLVAFVTTGFVVRNYSKFGEGLHHPIQKLALPIFIIFFTVAGASINFLAVSNAILLGGIIFVFRAFGLWVSVSTASKISKEKIDFTNYGWLGFLSIGGLILGLGIVIANRLPGLGDEIKNVITALVALNIFLGPVLLKIGLIKSAAFNTKKEEVEEKPEQIIQKPEQKKKEKSYFNEPQFNDESLNKSLYNIIFKINNVLSDFERRFIYFRGEQSVELIVSITERYTEEYGRIRKTILKPGISTHEIKIKLLEAKKRFAEGFIELCEQRKKIEKNILELEPLIGEIFYSLVDLTDGLKSEHLIEMEPEWFVLNGNENWRGKVWKFKQRIKVKIWRMFDKNYVPKRKINYRNLAKYFLAGESAIEILETVNLVGSERLTTLRKTKSIFEDIVKYLDEIEQIIINDKDNPAVINIIIDRFAEVHQQIVNEINIYSSEINTTTDEITGRLYFALATPFNRLINVLKIDGTYKYDARKFRYSKIFGKSETIKDRALVSIGCWANYYEGFLGLFEKEIYISKLNSELNEAVNISLVDISTEINNNLRSVSTQLKESIKKFETTINEKKDETLADTVQFVKHGQREYFLNLLEGHIHKLEAIHTSRKLNSLIENLIEKFSSISENLPEDIPLLEEKDLQLTGRLPKPSHLKYVKIRSLSKTFLVKKLPRSIGELNELLVNHLNFTIIELKNFITIVNFHFNTALKELENNSVNGKSIATDLFNSLNEKLNDRVSQLNGQIDRLEQNIDNKIIQKVNEVISEINNLVINSSMLSVDFFMKKEKGKKRLMIKSSSLFDRIAYEIKKYSVIIRRNYRSYFKPTVDDLLESMNLISPEEATSRSESVLFSEEKLKKLPFIYRKLFDGSPLEASEFFFGKNEFLKEIEFAKKEFKANRASSTVIVGEPGSGKRSLLNAIRNYALQNEEYIYHQFQNTLTEKDELLSIFSELFGFQRRLSLDEIILFLNDKSKKKVIITENINKLFVRTVDGYEALESFIYLLSMTYKNVFWICTLGKNCWNFLEPNFDLTSIFSHQIDPAKYHKEDLRKIVLSRHQATGYNLEYLPDNLKQFRIKLRKQKSFDNDQAKLSYKYFKKLDEYSEGNIISAMYYWLQSIHSVKENTIVIRPPKKLNLKFLSMLDNIYYLTVANIIIHGWLTDEEHSRIFNMPMERSRDILNSLVSYNLIYLDQLELYSNKYFLNKFIYKVIEKELKQRNIFS